MKVFVSQPMNGESEAIIQSRNYDAECWLRDNLGERIESVSAYTNDECPEKMTGPQIGLWYMARSIEKMTECDAILMWGEWQKSRGCKIEAKIAQEYGLPIIVKELPNVAN